MKTLLCFALALLPLAHPVRADIPPPNPTTFSLTKLADCPKYKFFYTTDTATPAKDLKAIQDSTSVTVEKDARLFVQGESGAPEEFARLKHEYRGNRFALEIRGITSEGLFTKKLKVDYALSTTPPPPFQGNGPVRPPPRKPAPSAAQPGPLPHFALAGLSLGALVFMRTKKKALLLTAVGALAVTGAHAADTGWAEGLALFPSEKAVHLFNGRDLTGWEGQTEKYWSVEDGTIKGANKEGTAASTYLFTKASYRNFRLLFEVKQTRGAGFSTMHSAVCVLGEKFTDSGDPFGFKGPLLMFCGDWGIWDAHGRNRVFPPGQNGPMSHPAERVGDWNRIEILVLGDRIHMVANGAQIMDFTDQAGALKTSPIGLQLHYNTQPQEWHFRGLILTENPEDKLLTIAP